MSKLSPLTKTEHHYHSYGGRCRNCGTHQRWVVSARTPWKSFYNLIVEQKFPAFMGGCEVCSCQCVFDFTVVLRDEQTQSDTEKPGDAS